MTHAIKHIPEAFPAAPSSLSSRARSFLENGWVATEVLSFLCVYKEQEGSEEVSLEGQRPLQAWESARMVCKAWETHSLNALKTQFRSAQFPAYRLSTPEEVSRYSEIFHRYHSNIDIKTFRCSNLDFFKADFPLIEHTLPKNLNLDQHDRERMERVVGEMPTFFQNHADQLRELQYLFREIPKDLTDWMNGCTTLETLYIDITYALEPDEEEAFLQGIVSLGRSSQMIRSFTWEWLNDRHQKNIFDPVLRAMPSLTYLSLVHIRMSEEEMQAIANSSVKQLFLESIDAAPSVLGKYLGKIESLTLGHFKWSRTQPNRSQGLRDLLQRCQGLRSLVFHCRDDMFGLDDDSLAVIGASSPQLSSLYLGLGKYDSNSDVLSMEGGYLPLLKACFQLGWLDLTGRMISDDQLTALRLQYPAVDIVHSKPSMLESESEEE